MRPGVQDQPGQHGETPLYQKYKNLDKRSGAHLSSQLEAEVEGKIARACEGQAAVSQDHATPAWGTEWDSKKQKQITNKVNKIVFGMLVKKKK